MCKRLAQCRASVGIQTVDASLFPFTGYHNEEIAHLHEVLSELYQQARIKFNMDVERLYHEIICTHKWLALNINIANKQYQF